MSATPCDTTKQCWRIRSGRKKGQCTSPSPWNVYKKKFNTNDAAAWRQFKEENDLTTKVKANKWACREVVKAGQHFAPFFEHLPDIKQPICTDFDPSDILSTISEQSFQLHRSVLQRHLSACKKNLRVASFEQPPRSSGRRFDVALVKSTGKMLTVVILEDNTAGDRKNTRKLICINEEHLPNDDRTSFEQSADFVCRDMQKNFSKVFMTSLSTSLVLVMCGYIVGNIISVEPDVSKAKLVNACLCYVGISPTENNFEIQRLRSPPKPPKRPRKSNRSSSGDKKKVVAEKKKNKKSLTRRHRYDVPAGTIAPRPNE